ncbi:MAG: hypothetical protein PVI86_11390 [Phycisphaerae bacterium]|jgi:hypothetical protein
MTADNILESAFRLFETLLPDFVLAFTFFTALSYATLSRFFGKQRPAVAMSGALGLALAVGLVWWERDHGRSIRDLGPVGIVFAIAVLALVVFGAIKPKGGTWAAAGLALGICVGIALTFGVVGPGAIEFVQGAAVLALIVGCLLFLVHQHTTKSHSLSVPAPSRAEIAQLRREVLNTHRDHDTANWLRRGLHKLRFDGGDLFEHPEERTDVLLQLRRILPAEGWLTDQMAQLRKKAYYIRKGHVAKLEETKHIYAKLGTPEKRKAAIELAARYRKLIGMDERLERLDKAVAETERRIKELTKEAHDAVAGYEFQKVEGLLKNAEKLQAHNTRLIKAIGRTEEKLVKVAEAVARETGKVDGG